jgi:Na+/melibiose symporter-like transporter
MNIPPKRRFFSIIVTVVVFVSVAFFFVYKDTKRLKTYYDKTTEITLKDSLNLKVEDVWLNHGYLFLNNKYYLMDARVNMADINFTQVTKILVPFYIIKNIILRYFGVTKGKKGLCTCLKNSKINAYG